jgi:hypothetical protein
LISISGSAGITVVDLLDTAVELVDCVLNDGPAVLQASWRLLRVRNTLAIVLSNSFPEGVSGLISAFPAIFSCLKPGSAELDVLMVIVVLCAL